MEHQKCLKDEGKKDSSVNEDSEESEDDANRIAATLPVIIEIKVKADRREKPTKKKKYSQHVVPLPELSAADFIENDDRERELWQIFERKPSDQYNKALRDSLNDKLVNLTSEYNVASNRNEIENLRSLLINSDGSDCDCQCGDKLTMIPPNQNHFYLPELSLPLQSKSSTPQTIERAANPDNFLQKTSKALSSHESIDIDQSVQSEFHDDSYLSNVHDLNKRNASYLSAKSSAWFETLEMPNKWTKSTNGNNINCEARTEQTQRKHTKVKSTRVSSIHNDLRKEKHSFPFKNILIIAATKDKQSEHNETPTTIVPSLNYRKIADALRNANIVEKCQLVEALEKRSTQSNEEQRNSAIVEFVHFDLLQLRTQSPLSLIQKLLINMKNSDSDLMLQYFTSSLLNAIVSCDDGRNYFVGTSLMCSCDDVGIGLLDNLFKSNLIEAQTMEQLLQFISKLSANNFHRDNFIKSDLQHWALEELVENEYSGSEEYLVNVIRLIQNLATYSNNIYDKNECKQLFVLSARIYERFNVVENCLCIQQTLYNLLRFCDAQKAAHEINLEEIFRQKLEKPKISKKPILEEFISEIMSGDFKTSYKYIANGRNKINRNRNHSFKTFSDSEAYLQQCFQLSNEFKPIKVNIKDESTRVKLNSRKRVDSFSFSFFENCMDFRREHSFNNRIFPSKAYSSLLSENYKTIDFSPELRGPTKIDAKIAKSSVKLKTISASSHGSSIKKDAVSESDMMKNEMPTSDNLIVDNASESENRDVVVRKFSCDSPLKLDSINYVKNLESRIPIRTSSTGEKVSSAKINKVNEKKIESTIDTHPDTEIKTILNIVNEFIPIDPPVQLEGSDENDVVVKVFKSKRKRSRSLGYPKQMNNVHDKRLQSTKFHRSDSSLSKENNETFRRNVL